MDKTNQKGRLLGMLVLASLAMLALGSPVASADPVEEAVMDVKYTYAKVGLLADCLSCNLPIGPFPGPNPPGPIGDDAVFAKVGTLADCLSCNLPIGPFPGPNPPGPIGDEAIYIRMTYAEFSSMAGCLSCNLPIGPFPGPNPPGPIGDEAIYVGYSSTQFAQKAIEVGTTYDSGL